MLFWLGLAAAGVFAFAAVSRVFDPPTSLGLLMVAGFLVLSTFLWYRTASKRAEQQQVAARQELLERLQKQIALAGDQLEVRSPSNLLILVLFAAAAAMLTRRALAAPSAESIGAASVMVALACLMSCTVIPFVGRPRLIIGREGVAAPILGPVRWDDIESIALREVRYRGSLVGHALDLLIPASQDAERGMHWSRRMMRRVFFRSAPPFVVVNLKSPSIPAETIHALCSSLWSRATGRKNPGWNVWLRERVPEFRQLETHLAKLERAERLAKTDPQAALQILEQAAANPLPAVPSGRRLTGRELEGAQALADRLRHIDPQDRAARERAIRDHVREFQRTTPLTWAITVLVVMAIVIVVAMLVRPS